MRLSTLILSVFLPLILFAQNPKGFDAMITENVEDDVPYIQAEQLQTLLGSNKILLLDTRQKKEYEVSHIKGAVLVGYDNFNLNRLNGISKNKKIILYCSIGYRSGQIGEQLIEAGYKNVFNLYGGIFNWVNHGYKVVNDQGRVVKKVHGYNQLWKRWVNDQRAEAILN